MDCGTMESCLGGSLFVCTHNLYFSHIPLEHICRVYGREASSVLLSIFSRLRLWADNVGRSGRQGNALLLSPAACNLAATADGRAAESRPQLCLCMLHDPQTSGLGGLCRWRGDGQPGCCCREGRQGPLYFVKKKGQWQGGKQVLQ